MFYLVNEDIDCSFRLTLQKYYWLMERGGQIRKWLQTSCEIHNLLHFHDLYAKHYFH